MIEPPSPSPGLPRAGAVVATAPEVVDAGAEFLVTVRTATPAPGDPRPFRIVVTDNAELIAERVLTPPASHKWVTELTLKAPATIGEFTWNVVVSRGGADRVSSPFTFRTRPHATSLAVWGHPSPVVRGVPFRMHAGARCAAGCPLTGQEIVVCDDAGAVVGRGTLGSTPWPGTRLFWTELDVAAPPHEGHYQWTAAFPAAGADLPHGETSATFSFLAVPPPEHSVRVRVTDEQTGAPLEDADVRLGVYRGTTDGAGWASFLVPRGPYELTADKPAYEGAVRSLHVSADVEMELAARPMPVENPDRYWQG